MKSFLTKSIDFVTQPITVLSVIWLKFLRLYILPLGERSEKIMMHFGLYPFLDQYYEPLINPKKHLKKSLAEDRALPSIDFNVAEQIKLLEQFEYNEELLTFPLHEEHQDFAHFYYHNEWYSLGDAEYLYNMIRHTKPNRLIEVGAGFSTLLAREAIKKNQEEDPNYQCQHICIEPFEMPWLKNLEVELIREKVETLDLEFFHQLDKNDILFIDSSHIIRPQGDVLFEYLEILPQLNSGVFIHVHDIFTPKDYYVEGWIMKHHLLWNEQYLLEAFLSYNDKFKITGALNYLAHHHKKELASKCPIFGTEAGTPPRAFWMQKL